MPSSARPIALVARIHSYALAHVHLHWFADRPDDNPPAPPSTHPTQLPSLASSGFLSSHSTSGSSSSSSSSSSLAPPSRHYLHECYPDVNLPDKSDLLLLLNEEWGPLTRLQAVAWWNGATIIKLEAFYVVKRQ